MSELIVPKRELIKSPAVISRRFTALAALGAFSTAALIAGTKDAQAATPTFEDVLFKSSGSAATAGTAARTEAQRWGDFINVKDYGAVGDNSHDDTSAIQAAINAAATQASQFGAFTLIYFPAGTYKVTAAITFGNNANLKGIFISGDGPGSRLQGSVTYDGSTLGSGYVLSSTLNVANSGPIKIADLAVVNTQTGVNTGAIMLLTPIPGIIENCFIEGFQAINLVGGGAAGNPSTQVKNCTVNCSAAYSAGNHSFAISMSNGHQVIGCDAGGFDNAIRMTNSGCTVIGGRYEANNIAINVGIDDTGSTIQASNVFIAAVSMEANQIGINVNSGGNITIVSVNPSGTTGAHSGVSTTGIDLTNAVGTTLICSGGGGLFSNAAVVLPNNVSNITCINCTPNNGSSSGASGVVWSGGNAVAFIACNQAITIETVAFASLPSSPWIGQEKYISDPNVVTWGSNITAGSGVLGAVWGKWNGTNWTVSAK